MHIIQAAGRHYHYEVNDNPVAPNDFYSSLGSGHIVMFAHGYNNSQAEALARARRFQALFGGKTPTMVLLRWPSEGRVNGYLEDRKHAKAAGAGIGQAFADLAGRGLGNPVHILAHSMGGRAVKHGLKAALSLRSDLAGLFQNLIWCAADIPSYDLQPGGAAGGAFRLAGTVWNIYAPDDDALKASKWLSTFRGRVTRRAGRMVSKYQAWDSRLLAVDAGAVNQIYDGRNGHTYFCDAEDGQPGLVHHLIRRAMMHGEGERWPGSAPVGALPVQYV